ncbi:MAG: transglycosylase domain-containing protein, partial [Spirochaetales bacterium]
MRFPARLLVTNAAILTAAALLAWGVLAATNEPLPGDYSLVVVDAKDEPLRVYLNEREQWHLPPSNRQPPSNLVAAVTTFEDKRFAVHVGVDPVAAARALYQNVTSGRRVSGASTITMQLARIAGGRRRTLFSKAIESARAVLFELRYTKGEILQLYLDHAPYGSNIVGYQTAARAYFQKPAERLSWAEAATLAVLPNAPGLVAPGASGAALLDRRNELLDKLLAEGYLSESQHAAAMREPVPAGRHAFAVFAP